MFHLGWLYEHGATRENAKARDSREIDDDNDHARKWYEKAAEKGNALAMTNLGTLYEGDKDFSRARDLYEKAADKGEAGAMTNLGSLFRYGKPPDYAKAREVREGRRQGRRARDGGPRRPLCRGQGRREGLC